MRNNVEVKSFISEQLSGIRADDTKEFQTKVISSIYAHLEKLGHDTATIKLMIDEVIVEKLKFLVKKLKDLNKK